MGGEHPIDCILPSVVTHIAAVNSAFHGILGYRSANDETHKRDSILVGPQWLDGVSYRTKCPSKASPLAISVAQVPPRSPPKDSNFS